MLAFARTWCFVGDLEAMEDPIPTDLRPATVEGFTTFDGDVEPMLVYPLLSSFYLVSYT